jgi:probable rRNA maturation factor
VNLRLLKEIAQDLLTCDFPHRRVELGIHLVAAPEMIRLNEQFLSHAGSTDVITFDHADSAGQASSPVRTNTVGPARGRQDAGPVLWGEIFICLDDAVAQARRFRTTWQSEVARYLIHGLLHLHGYDDRRPAARLKMKREENRLLREVSRRFTLGRLARRPRLSKGKVQR